MEGDLTRRLAVRDQLTYQSTVQAAIWTIEAPCIRKADDCRKTGILKPEV